MRFMADFHIHSHFSIATSKQLIPEYLDFWARVKGLSVVGSGDFTHPGWLKELKEKLIPAEQGLFKLKDELKIKASYAPDTPVRFMLTAEISNIYKKYGRVRKVHNVIFAPDFVTVEKIQFRLASIGNITSDGRPILGMDSRDLLKIALECNEQIFFVPAHIWTPWFSALGSKSGFDSIDECYDDLAPHIFAVETGLSTDPPMNWMCSFLDKYTLLSNSDAHSPEKLGRNANIFDTQLSYDSIIEAIKSADKENFLGTIDLYPQEGKYHFDGHRKCNVCWNPAQTLKNNGICPVCGKKVTVGVLNRIAMLADREDVNKRPRRRLFRHIIPLKEMLAEISGRGENTKQVTQAYNTLIQKAGSEFNILLNLPLEELSRLINPTLLEAVSRMRTGDVHIKHGFDGEYGRISVFAPGEDKTNIAVDDLFLHEAAPDAGHALPGFNLHEYRLLKDRGTETPPAEAAEPPADYAQVSLNKRQREAVNHFRGPALIIAGPGTGKTRVLTYRIAWLVQEKHVNPQHILALTFTNKAAAEMKNRLEALLPKRMEMDTAFVSTFHAFGLQVLKEQSTPDFRIINEAEKNEILQKYIHIPGKEVKRTSEAITAIKQKVQQAEDIPDTHLQETFAAYRSFLSSQRLLDLDDLIYQTLLLFKENPQTAQIYRSRFQWVLVDEYQDINYAQYVLIGLLCPAGSSNLYAIGDPNQAIYGFRGADAAYIYRFVEDYPQARLYRLDKSYRCSQKILLASHNILEASSSSLSGVQEGVNIQIVAQKSDRSEAEYIARSIEQMIGGLQFFSMDSGITQGNKKKELESLADFAILCRLRQQMPVIEEALNNHRIPCQKVSEGSFFAQRGVALALHLLHLAHRPDNRYLQGKLISEKILQQDRLAVLNNRVSAEKQIGVQLEMIIHDFLSDEDSLGEQEKTKLLRLAALYGRDWQAFLQDAALQKGPDMYEHNVEKVTLMTMHASKGLEFNCVYIAGCEQGLIPYSIIEKQKAHPEEERRLLYVAMTRAKKYLFLTHAGKRVLFGRKLKQERSSFLDRIERELTEQSRAAISGKKKKPDNQLSLFDK